LQSLPENPEDLELGVLIDKKDPSKGWVPVDIKEQELAGPKGTKKKVGGRKSILNESPLGAGLSDGTWIAYRITHQPKQPQEELEDGTPDVDVEEDPGWDVVIPSFEEEEE
jgi:hypothetical protein